MHSFQSSKLRTFFLCKLIPSKYTTTHLNHTNHNLIIGLKPARNCHYFYFTATQSTNPSHSIHISVLPLKWRITPQLACIFLIPMLGYHYILWWKSLSAGQISVHEFVSFLYFVIGKLRFQVWRQHIFLVIDLSSFRLHMLIYVLKIFNCSSVEKGRFAWQNARALKQLFYVFYFSVWKIDLRFSFQFTLSCLIAKKIEYKNNLWISLLGLGFGSGFKS